MKSTRRHELQQNTLDAEIAKVVGFFREHGSKLGWGALILVVVVLSWVVWNRRAKARRVEVQSQYDQLSATMIMPDVKAEELISGFRALSDQDTVRWIAADSLLALGRIYATRVLLETAPDKQARALANATSAYQRVIDEFKNDPPVVAAATLGLGKLAEGQRRFDKAKARYQAVLDMQGLQGYPVRDAAQQALHTLQQFGPEPQLATNLPAWAKPTEEAQKPTTPFPAADPAKQ